MKISDHLEKVGRFKNTLKKLDDEEDHETVVELCVLIASHYMSMRRSTPQEGSGRTRTSDTTHWRASFARKSASVRQAAGWQTS